MESLVPGNWHAGFGGAARGDDRLNVGTAPLVDSYNSLHWVRDVTFAEDASQVRVGSGPQVLSALANLAISALRLVGAGNVAAELRRHGQDPLLVSVTFGLT